MSEQNVAVIRRLIDKVWNRRQFDVVDELFAPLAPIFESGTALPVTFVIIWRRVVSVIWRVLRVTL